jgi:hypothetical protein
MDEILQILEDKSKLKNITVETNFKGFPHSMVTTDKKRI